MYIYISSNFLVDTNVHPGLTIIVLVHCFLNLPNSKYYLRWLLNVLGPSLGLWAKSLGKWAGTSVCVINISDDSFFFFCKFMYLATLGISCSMQTLNCSMWNLVPWSGKEPGLPALGAWKLSHWTTREVTPMILRMRWLWETLHHFLPNLLMEAS